METKLKRRSWIMGAVIAFLSIMLLLTFFSNTIMNRSLAQVATQYITSGSISAKIRGTGNVTANAPYEVSIKEGRVVQSVMVKTGDRVEIGDVLIRLTEDASTQLKDAQDALEDLRYQYRLFVLNMADRDYTRENREISKLRADIAKLEEKRAGLLVSDAEITAAEIAVESAQAKCDAAAQLKEDAQKALDDFDAAYSGGSGDYESVLKEYRDALTNKGAIELQYKEKYDIFVEAANEWRNHDARRYPISTYMEAIYNTIQDGSDPDVVLYFSTPEHPVTVEELPDYAQAYLSMTEANERFAKAELEYSKLSASSTSAARREELVADLKQASEIESLCGKELKAAQDELAKLEQNKIDYDANEASIENLRDQLENEIFNLSQTQKTDNKQAQRDQLDLEKLKKQLAEQEEYVEKLSSGDTMYEVKANAAGVVSSINITAGKTTVPDETLMTIDQTDRGYTTSFSVTNAQAQRVQIGDHAEVTTYNWWFSGNIDAVLTAITPNPSDPRNSKMLVFTVTGDVSNGDQLNLSIGQRAQNYDLIVPKSAIRSDSNGTYVLLLEQKASALGNRYYATRIDVEVLASDDTQSAVSGALSSWGDYVITSASKSIEPGDQVRLSEN